MRLNPEERRRVMDEALRQMEQARGMTQDRDALNMFAKVDEQYRESAELTFNGSFGWYYDPRPEAAALHRGEAPTFTPYDHTFLARLGISPE